MTSIEKILPGIMMSTCVSILKRVTPALCLLVPLTSNAAGALGYNIIVVFADDISAREFPAYGSTVWTPPAVLGANTSDPQFRARTPVLDRLARDGAVVRTCWANAVCSPSRATIMTGRYAHLHKWWQNNDIGKYRDKDGNLKPWPLYQSSPLMIGHVAKKGGYATFWAGKTQMKNSDLRKFGFDSIMTSPANDSGMTGPSSHTDFRLKRVHGKTAPPGKNKRLPQKVFLNVDSGKETTSSWPERSFFWQPSVGLIDWPPGNKSMKTWPNTPESKKRFGVHTYGPDVEMDFILSFMDKAHAEGKPFFIYHTPHLGHAARNWLGQKSLKGDSRVEYPGTPKLTWDGYTYTRTKPKITGDKGVYDTHGTVTEPGIHRHIEYLDYQVWQYMQKLEALGIREKTVFIFTADNGTLRHGKMRIDKQRGPHVPFYIYIPGMQKRGKQEILVDVTDVLPTIAEAAGVKIQDGYEINGKSLLPYFMGEAPKHRDWIYTFLFEKQLIRGHHVLRDGNGAWWDVAVDPADLDAYPRITDWSTVSDAHRSERDQLEAVMPRFDKHVSEHDAPGVSLAPEK